MNPGTSATAPLATTSGNLLPAYISAGSKRYREHLGLYFEQFSVGQKFKHRPGLNFTQQDNQDEALDTINAAQLHYDAHYAAQTEWKKNLGVSTLTLQRIIGMASKTYLKRHSILAFQSIAMTHPVFGGDTLYTESSILGKEEYPKDPNAGVLTVQFDGVNQHGTVVTKIVAKLLIYKRGCHPEDHANAGATSSQLSESRFTAYHRLPDGTLVEGVGLYFEDFNVGEIFEHRPGKTILAAESMVHSFRSLELSPQYTDLNYEPIKSGPMSFRINETFLVAVLTALTTRTFGRVVANLGWTDLEIIGTVKDREAVYAESEILSKRDSKSRPTQGILTTSSRLFDSQRNLLISYNRALLVYKRGLGPYEAAGY